MSQSDHVTNNFLQFCTIPFSGQLYKPSNKGGSNFGLVILELYIQSMLDTT